MQDILVLIKQAIAQRKDGAIWYVTLPQDDDTEMALFDAMTSAIDYFPMWDDGIMLGDALQREGFGMYLPMLESEILNELLRYTVPLAIFRLIVKTEMYIDNLKNMQELEPGFIATIRETCARECRVFWFG